MNKGIIKLISLFLLCFMSFYCFAQNLDSRKQRFLSSFEGLKNIPVDSSIAEEKTTKINTLIEKLNGLTAESELENIYKEFLSVRDWLLKNAIEKPTLPAGSFREDNDFWILENPNTTVKLSKKDLVLSVSYQQFQWDFLPSDENDVIFLTTKFSLISAKQIKFEELTTGFSKAFTLRFGEFPDFPDLAIYITFYLSDNQLTIDIASSNITGMLQEIRFPKAVSLNPSPEEFSVLPVMQGILLPANYPQKFSGKDLCNSRMLYMPWWGHLKGDKGLLTILATSYDAGVEYQHPEGGPTRVQPIWYSSLGKLGYLRSIQYYFLSNANYVTLAKQYRQWVKEHRHFVSLKEKLVRCPLLEQIIGVPVIHTGALYHYEETSHYYNKDTVENNYRLVPLSKISEQLKELKNKGVDKAYVHLDGWGYLGYDSGHPDVIPPGYEAGGVEGLKELSKTCKESGYVLALHDQYRDFYLNAVSFNPKLAVSNQSGQHEQHSTWCGGPQMILSPRFILPYVQRNHNWLINRGVEIQGVYIDVLSIIPLEESFEPFCPVSRTECADYRIQAFQFLKSKGYIMSSEEPTDYLASVIDLVHHGPYWIHPSLISGEKVGIPIPLFNLVYHDSLIMPWGMAEDGGWGIPKGDAGYLHCILNAGMPYLGIQADDQEINRVKEVCALAKHCQFLELINHEFLNENYRKQKTTFSDGTTIIVDFDQKTYEINYPNQ